MKHHWVDLIPRPSTYATTSMEITSIPFELVYTINFLRSYSRRSVPTPRYAFCRLGRRPSDGSLSRPDFASAAQLQSYFVSLDSVMSPWPGHLYPLGLPSDDGFVASRAILESCSVDMCCIYNSSLSTFWHRTTLAPHTSMDRWSPGGFYLASFHILQGLGEQLT